MVGPWFRRICKKVVVKLRFLLSPAAVLLASDCIAVFTCYVLAFALRFITPGSAMTLSIYTSALPWMLVFPLLYFTLGLYPGTFLLRSEELKRLSIATSVGFLCIVFFTFIAKEGHLYSRITLTLAWFLNLFFVPAFRILVRRRFWRCPWWSVPCVLFGNGNRLVDLCAALKQAQPMGVRPAVVILDDKTPMPDIASCLGPTDVVVVERIPMDNAVAARNALKLVADRLPRAYAVINFDSTCAEERQAWLDIIDQCFQRIILIPDMAVGGRIWAMAVSIGRLSGILVRQNLLDPRRMFLKRSLDLLLTLATGIVAVPLLFALGIAVRLDSPGPVLFRQQRLGRGGKLFTVYKFRTMAANAEELLEKYLAENPDAQREWEESQKLKDDPRITKVGLFLRKTSLDELPQLLNVLKGDMSIVGPRPIVDDEIARYGKQYELYIRVRPGITGLWQVSGRNNLPYADRVWLDRHYVCNWSVWLDILIIARTVPEVLHCSGAY